MARLLAQLFGHALGHGDGGDAARLGHHDACGAPQIGVPRLQLLGLQLGLHRSLSEKNREQEIIQLMEYHKL